MRHLALLVTLVLVSACGSRSPTTPHVIERLAPRPALHATPFDPPPEYRERFLEVRSCFGLSGSFDDINWLKVEPEDWRGSRFAGYWFGPNDIYIETPFLDDLVVVGHETLHFLRQKGGHPLEFFAHPVCGPLVSY